MPALGPAVHDDPAVGALGGLHDIALDVEDAPDVLVASRLDDHRREQAIGPVRVEAAVLARLLHDGTVLLACGVLCRVGLGEDGRQLPRR